MNYRHIFHAGNFADVLKHATLANIIAYLQLKPAPIRVIETHAGAGRYDLSSEKARRTGEWREGVGRMEDAFDERCESFLAPWRAALAAFRAASGREAYPGSPLIAQSMLRRDDVYVGAELHGDTFSDLVRSLGRDARCKALNLNGWHALRAGAPPPERRGLILIDPAFEAADEWEAAAREAAGALAKWPTGAMMIWYPLKNPRQADDLTDKLAGARRPLLRVELMVDELESPRLAGCGLLIVNPPWTLAAELEHALPQLAGRLARGSKAGYRCETVRS